MKNTNTVTESSSTCTDWMTSSTRIRFQRSKPETWACSCGSIRGSAATSRLACSSGVPAHARTMKSSSTSSSTRSTSSGSRTSRNSTARPNISSTVTHSSPNGRLVVISHASALTKRNVTKTSRSGSAREAIGTRNRTLPRVRDSAKPRIGRACSAVAAYQSRARPVSDIHTAGPAYVVSVAHARAPTPAASRASTRARVTRRRGRSPARAAARSSATK
ncbi:hypothetical protein HOO61_13405 [Nocardioides sp. zg-1230]|nr:hypothetical protein [Nocardioides sp. zg-1230]